MIRIAALTIAALSFAPASYAAQACTPAQQAAAQLSSSGLSCTQWLAQFDGSHATETARNDRPAAPRS